MARAPRTLLLVVLLLFTVAAAINYERNLQADLGSRPFGGYDDEEIELLLEAYRGEVEAWEERAAASRSAEAAQGGRNLQDHLRAFEEARRRNESWQDVAGRLGEKEAVLRALQAEQRERAEQGAPQRTLDFLRRLFTV